MSAILQAVGQFIRTGVGDFEALAQELIGWQRARIPLVAALAARRGWRPGDDLAEAPAVPSEAFRRAELHAEPDAVVHRFTTSGTSGRPGAVCCSRADLELHDDAIDASAAIWLFPDHRAVRTRVLRLAPTPAQAPAMIMAVGMARLHERFGRPDGASFLGPSGLDVPGLCAALDAAERDGVPVTLVGASFGFVHLFDGLRAQGRRWRLPPGSRSLDAGGFKGRSREVTRDDLKAGFTERFDIPPDRSVNLLGLTEHNSQFYDDSVLGAGASGLKQNPPWTRTWAVDPVTLAPLPHGQTGLLRHLDLANGGRPCVVQTEDLGATSPEGFTVLGRASGAEARGCSLTVDELLERRA